MAYPGHIKVGTKTRKVASNCSSVKRIKKTASCKVSKNIKRHA